MYICVNIIIALWCRKTAKEIDSCWIVISNIGMQSVLCLDIDMIQIHSGEGPGNSVYCTKPQSLVYTGNFQSKLQYAYCNRSHPLLSYLCPSIDAMKSVSGLRKQQARPSS